MDASRECLDLLREYESRNVLYVDPAGDWPIVWERAQGCDVWDADGRRYLDLTAAFGVAAAGHANPRVVEAGQRQMAKLLHAMGDVHPHRLKAELARALSRLTFERWRPRGQETTTGKTIFCNSGFEAVEAALKTAHLATGRTGVLAFEGAYHGLGYGALNTTHRELFRSPFRRQLREFATFVPFPEHGNELPGMLGAAEEAFAQRDIGAVLVEPIQGRGGMRVPPRAFLPDLAALAREHGALLVLDEIYTGCGRTGRWFALEHDPVTPDLICLGKALTGGFPLSACVGRADLMDAAWPPSEGEAIHTSTFLGHPVGCAMALAELAELEREGLVARAETLGALLLKALRALPPPHRHQCRPRGRGLMVGLELRRWDGAPGTALSLAVTKRMLRDGFILLPDGPEANVLAFTPPLTIAPEQLESAVAALEVALREESAALR